MISIDSEVYQTDTSPDYANRIQALTEQIQQSSGDKAAALYEALGQVQLKVGGRRWRGGNLLHMFKTLR